MMVTSMGAMPTLLTDIVCAGLFPLYLIPLCDSVLETDTTWPNTINSVKGFADIPTAGELEKILCGNAARLLHRCSAPRTTPS